MRPPDGAGCQPGKVWKLKKSLYGLPPVWKELECSHHEDLNGRQIRIKTDDHRHMSLR